MKNELNSDIKMNNNPSTKQNGMQDDEYDYQYASHNIFSLQYDEQNTIKMDFNPSYERGHGCDAVNYNTTAPTGLDVAFHQNPPYSSIAIENVKVSEDEDEDGYVETNSQSTQRADYCRIIESTTHEEESAYDNDTDDSGKVEINPNPFYVSVSGGVKLEDNPLIMLGQCQP